MSVCVCMCNQQVSEEWGEERRERLPAVLLRVDFPTAALAKASAGRGSRKRYDCACLVLGRVTAFQFHGYSYCPFWSPSIFLCKAVSFSVIESILRLIVSVSMLTALPTASIMTGSLVRL